MVSGEWWQTKFNVSPGPGLWSLVLGPLGPDLGPDLDLTWDLDLDLSLTTLTLHDSLYLIASDDIRNPHNTITHINLVFFLYNPSRTMQ